MTVKNYLLAAKKAPLYTLMWQGIFFAVGVLLVIGINFLFNDETTYICLGAAMGALGTLAGVLGQNNVGGPTRFRLAVSMGMTRRSFLVWDTAINVVLAGLGFLTCWVLYHVEQGIYALVFPGYTMEFTFDWLADWRVLGALLLALAALQLFFTGVILRFGQRGFVVAWLVAFGGWSIVPPAIRWAENGGTSLYAQLGRLLLRVGGLLTPAAWICVGAAALAAAALVGVRWLWRAEVRL